MTLAVRPATMDDARDLFDWRIDPLTRRNSRHGEPVEWEAHLAWLEASLANPARRLLIAEIDGEPAATGRFDYGDEVEMSITVAPKWRGKGVALRVVKALMAGEPSFVGYIKAENVATQRLMRAAGLVRVSEGPLQKWAYSNPSAGERLAEAAR